MTFLTAKTTTSLSHRSHPLGTLETTSDIPNTRLNYSPHEHIFFQGDHSKGIYEVLSGTVILYKVMSDGRRQIQDFASEGDILALTLSERHDLSAEALTDVTIRFATRSAFDRAFVENAEFRRDIFNLVSGKLQVAREQALLLGRKSAMERTATFLLFLESRFLDPVSSYVAIRMSRGDMADYLGLTLETVSRMVSRLKKAGIIDLPQPNSFRITDRDALIAAAGDTEDDDFLYAA